MNSRDLQRTQNWAAQQKAQLDESQGVGPWGKSRNPQAQPMRDALSLAERDPQAYNRLASNSAIQASAAASANMNKRLAERSVKPNLPNLLAVPSASVQPSSTLTGTTPAFKNVNPFENQKRVPGVNYLPQKINPFT
jgi:hypothetical protein